MDPLSITTGIVTLYSTLASLKRFRDEYRNAPQVIKDIEVDCEVTFQIIRHAKDILDTRDSLLGPDDFESVVNIRAELAKHINLLQLQVEDLRNELLKFMLSQPSTRFGMLTSKTMLPWATQPFTEAHTKIVKRRKEFERLKQSLAESVNPLVPVRQRVLMQDL
jgi:hypothetical protein